MYHSAGYLNTPRAWNRTCPCYPCTVNTPHSQRHVPQQQARPPCTWHPQDMPMRLAAPKATPKPSNPKTQHDHGPQ
jgi:hypothetical protein